LTSVPSTPIPNSTTVPHAIRPESASPQGGKVNYRVETWAIAGQPGLSARVAEAGPTTGGGVPIVFLHGLVGLNDHWEGVVERVHGTRRCVLFEVPLLRLTGEDCSIEGVTRITLRYLRERLGQPAVLVGNSFGGHVAMRIACEDPVAVKGLVLAGASGLYERSLLANVQIRPSRAWLARKIGELFHDKSHVWESDIDRAYGELSERSGARAMVKLSRSARADHLGEKLHAVSSPTLLIWGRQDVVTPPETAEEFSRLIRGSRLEWIDQCGHAPMMEATGAFSAHLAGFVDGLSGR
jgi:2-hydroxy-6-oxonona-2,4-dienedioate hydrolase